MKINKFNIGLLAIGFMLISCEFDNYEEPGSFFTGEIVYQGEAINVAHKNVRFQLWESGWQKRTPIDVAISQDGSFSALLFDGNYMLIIPPHEGPYLSVLNPATGSDTISVVINGNKSMDIEVMPFYMVRNPAFSVTGRTVNGSCGIEKIITDANARDLQSVVLYVNITQFVDHSINIASTVVAAADITDLNNISINVDVPTFESLRLPDQDYVYVRIGVRIVGREDMVFSAVHKVNI